MHTDEFEHLNWLALQCLVHPCSSLLSPPGAPSKQSSSLSHLQSAAIQCPFEHWNLSGPQAGCSDFGQFVSSELSQQSFSPSHSHDFEMHAVVLAHGIKSGLIAVQFRGVGQFISSDASEQSIERKLKIVI